MVFLQTIAVTGPHWLEMGRRDKNQRQFPTLEKQMPHPLFPPSSFKSSDMRFAAQRASRRYAVKSELTFEGTGREKESYLPKTFHTFATEPVFYRPVLKSELLLKETVDRKGELSA